MAAITFIQDNTTDIDLAAVKAYCRIDNDKFDIPLGFIIAGVKGRADEYCNNPDFADWGGVVPPAVKLWILQAIDAIYQRPNMHSIRQDIWEQGSDYWEYDRTTQVEGLWTYRLEPGFGCS